MQSLFLTCTIKCEKEHLEALGLAIDQFLATLSQGHLHLPSEAEEMPLSNDTPSGMPKVELEIAQIALGFDRDRAILDILVHPSGPQKVDWTELSCRATLAQLKELEIRIYDISDLDTILQASVYGGTSTGCRINSVSELYVTNFKTKRTPAQYQMEIWRTSNNFLVGSFNFSTVK